MKKMIVIDDSFTLRIQVKKRFEEEGFNVLEAEDGLQGLELIKENSDLQLIMSDINMPGMDGLTMLEQVKETGLCPQAGRLVLTTETSERMKERGRNVGVHAWFTKPLQPKRLEILVDLVYKLLDRMEKGK